MTNMHHFMTNIHHFMTTWSILMTLVMQFMTHILHHMTHMAQFMTHMSRFKTQSRHTRVLYPSTMCVESRGGVLVGCTYRNAQVNALHSLSAAFLVPLP